MKVNLCPNCEGQGVLRQRLSEGYESVTCTRCDGTGRVETRTFSFDVPFGKKIENLNEIETQIFELIKSAYK